MKNLRMLGAIIGGVLVERGRRALLRLLLADELERRQGQERLEELQSTLMGAKGGSTASAPAAAPKRRGRPPKSASTAAANGGGAPDGRRQAQLAALAKGRETRARNAAARKQGP